MKINTGNHNVTLLKTIPYFGRVLYVLDIDGDYAYVYRSSGFSGTGHKGEILPFSGLAERATFSQVLGYIFKEIYYKGRWRNHMKNLSFDEDVVKFFAELKDKLPLIGGTDMDYNRDVIEKVVTEMESVREDRKPFDFSMVRL